MTKSRSALEFDGKRQYPQIDWILATKFAHLPPGKWLPIVVEYDLAAAPNPEDPLPWFAELSWLDPTLHRAVNVPSIFKDPPRVLQKKAFPFCTLLVDRDFLRLITLDPGWSRTILQAEVGPPLSDDAVRSLLKVPSPQAT